MTIHLFLSNIIENSKKCTMMDKTNNTIAIAMAAYNPPKTGFVRQVNSILNQTHDDFKLVITVDADDLKTLEDSEVKNMLSDERVMLVNNSERLGLIGNFQSALDYCVKEFNANAIAFSDQDDYWFPEKLDILFSTLKSCPPMSLVHSDTEIARYSGDDKSIIDPSLWATEKRNVKSSQPFQEIIRNIVTGGSCLFDINLAKKYSKIPTSFRFHDHYFGIVASFEGGVYPVNKVLYSYIQHDNNVVGSGEFKSIFHVGDNQSIITKSIDKYTYTNEFLDDLNQMYGLNVPLSMKLISLVLFPLYIFTDKALFRSQLSYYIGLFLKPFKR